MSAFTSDLTPVFKAGDVSDELREYIFNISVNAVKEFNLEREIAGAIKNQLDAKYGVTWHVIIGKSFGSYVTHEKGHFIYFYIGPIAVLAFRTA